MSSEDRIIEDTPNELSRPFASLSMNFLFSTVQYLQSVRGDHGILNFNMPRATVRIPDSIDDQDDGGREERETFSEYPGRTGRQRTREYLDIGGGDGGEDDQEENPPQIRRLNPPGDGPVQNMNDEYTFDNWNPRSDMMEFSACPPPTRSNILNDDESLLEKVYNWNLSHGSQRKGYNLTVGAINYHFVKICRPKVLPICRHLSHDLYETYFDDFQRDTFNTDLSRTIHQSEKEADILVEITSKNGGKTYAIVHYVIGYLKKYGGQCRVLVISPRRTFSHFMVEQIQDGFVRFSVLDENGSVVKVHNYLDYSRPTPSELEGLCNEEISRLKARERAYLGDLSVLVTQLDTSHKVMGNGYSTKFVAYDLVIFDEIETTFSHLTSWGACKQKRKYTAYLQTILATSKKAIISDADISGSTLAVINKMLQKGVPNGDGTYRPVERTVKICYNEYKNDNNKYFIWKGKTNMIESMSKSLMNGENIGIATNNKTIAKLVYAYLSTYSREYQRIHGRPLNSLLVTRDTAGGAGNIRTDPSVVYRQNVFVYTPTLLCGVSFNRVHFHKLYGIFTSGSANAKICCQMLLRIRKLISEEIHLNISRKSKDDFRVDKQLLIRLLEERYLQVQDFGPSAQRFLNPEGEKGFVEDTYTSIWMHTNISDRESKMDLETAILDNIKTHLPDPSAQIVEKPKVNSENNTLKELKDEILDRQCELVASAKDIDKATADERRENMSDLTEEELLEMDKYKIVTYYNCPPEIVTKEFVMEWGRPGRIEQLKSFCKCFLLTEEALEGRDERYLESWEGDSLIDLEFYVDHRNLFAELLDLFGFNIDDAMLFRFDWNLLRHVSLIRLNEILPKFVVKAKRKLPTKIEDHAEIPTFIRHVMYLVGIPLKKSGDILVVDYLATSNMLNRLRLKYHDNEDVLERIIAILHRYDVHKLNTRRHLEIDVSETNENGSSGNDLIEEDFAGY